MLDWWALTKQRANSNQDCRDRTNSGIKPPGFVEKWKRRGLRGDLVDNRWLLAILVWCLGSTAEASCLDSLAEHRAQIETDYLKSADSPFDKELKAGFAGFSYFAGDSAFCVPAEFELSANAKVFAMPSFNGKTLPFRKYGVFHFQLGGARRSLGAYQRMDLSTDQRQWVLVPFRDLTTGHETYGGGRYLQVDLPLPAHYAGSTALSILCAPTVGIPPAPYRQPRIGSSCQSRPARKPT